MNVPIPKDFSVLDNYNDEWLTYKLKWTEEEAKSFLMVACNSSVVPPTFLFRFDNNVGTFYTNSDSYKIFQNATKRTEKSLINATIKKAEDLICESKKSYVLIWTAINTYEILGEDSDRLIELGVHNNA